MSNLVQPLFERIKAESQKIIVGQEDLFELVVISFLAGGHVLLEGVEIVLLIMVSLVSSILGLGLGAFLDRILGTGRVMITIFETILSIIATPISLIGTTLLYFDLRIRKEAFDIEMMARNIQGEV